MAVEPIHAKIIRSEIHNSRTVHLLVL